MFTTLAQNPPQPLNGNKLKYWIFLSLILLQFSAVSQEIRRIDGKRYQVHLVEKGHTLFAISKKYAIDIDRIVAENPGVRAGLRIGEEVLIPLSDIDKRAARDNPPEIRGQYLFHTVQRKETLYSISKKHDVSINSILTHNPEAQGGLKIGQEIKIFVGDVVLADTTLVEPAMPDSLILHTVAPKETLYSLAKQYNVSVDSIKMVNDGLPEGLKAGSLVRIPKYTADYQSVLETKEEKPAELFFPTGTRRTYKVALMLPFSIDIQDSLSRKSDPTKPLDLYALTSISAEMYRGVQLAVDSLIKQGLALDLYVYDVTDDLIALDDLLHKPEIRDMHLIIGPLHRKSFERVSEFAAPLGIRTVAPVPNQKLKPVSAASCVVHTNAIQQMQFLGRYVARMHFTDNVLLVSSEKFKDYDFQQAFLNSYQSNLTYGDTLRPIYMEQYGIKTVQNNLSKTKKNIVVVPSSDLGFVSDFMNRLSNVSGRDYDITVMGMEKWLDYHNVDIQYKNRFNLTVPSSTYLNFENEPAQTFIERYRKEFDQEPGSAGYAFLGFDVAYYFLNGMLQYGLDLQKYFRISKAPGIHLEFNFDQRPDGCYNQHVYLLRYNDYQLNKIN